ncbi:MAG: DUF4838 domain-containing protein [Clostridiaceae bacterium]|nr:DUF4838 domain-containing protein [Clostridiaceae bacterium]
MDISYINPHETIAYAASELQAALKIVSNIDAAIIGVGFSASGIHLGLLEELARDDSDVDDALIDDVVDIDIRNGEGFIAGSNPRSVLIGVYEYLKSMGCCWVRPGDDGAYLPHCDALSHTFIKRRKATYPFRGECIEGAVSFENVRDTIRWLPKVGMNLFMMEQIVPYNYMSRWYKHSVSTVKTDENVSFEEIGAYVTRLEHEIKRCGLQLHALGHGYLLEPYGIHYKTWSDKYTLTDEAREDIALINGKRELYYGSPNFTQLCFARPEVRKKLINFLTGYAEKKPYIDFLHVWLADAQGNQCECDECRKHHPSDLYVQLLNELDAELTARGLDMRIVFIMYTDTLWAPLVEHFRNSRRFAFTTAFSRSYDTPYTQAHPAAVLPVWQRNGTQIKPSFDTMLRFLAEWRKVFDGPAFAFEYYFYVDHFNDPGYWQIAKTIWADIRALGGLGLSGLMSDQTQRSFFPNGFPLSLMGEALFNPQLDFDTYAKLYFHAAYGADAAACRDYLSGLSALFSPASLREHAQSVTQIDTGIGGSEEILLSWKNNPAAAARYAQIPGYIDAFLPVIRRNLDTQDRCHAASWKLLVYHAEYCRRLSALLFDGANGDMPSALQRFQALIQYLSEIEDAIQPAFDLVLFHQEWNRKLQ